MCGRAAQTRRAVRAAEDLLLGHGPPPPNARNAASRSSHQEESAQQHQTEYEWQDNYNMSPGMSCTIFFRDDNNNVQMDRKVWGLVPTGGTRNKPLPTGMTIHFEKLMFNARSDTLLDKYSFAPLFGKGRTCVVVVDGFFEWKPPALKGGKKQPHFVYRNKEEAGARPCLMFAGLWTSVPTGRMDEPTLDTFTIITTEACPSLEWLHSRMPLTIYDENLARQWLERPSRQLFKQLDEAATPPDYFQWHAVSPEMNSTKYRSQDSIKALPPPVSVKSFFSVVEKGAKGSTSATKRASSSQEEQSPTKGMSSAGSASLSLLKRSPALAVSTPTAKKPKTATSAKKGSIESFFSPAKPKK